MANCKHENATPTGELRPIASNCTKRKAKAVPRPVLLCKDCGKSFVRMATGTIKVVPGSPSFKAAMQAVRGGQITGAAAAARFGNMSEDERAELSETTACEHEYEPILLIYRCPKCGRLKQEQVRVTDDNPSTQR